MAVNEQVCGKGIGLVVANGGKTHDFEGVDKSTKPMPPYVAVNPTAGSASEMTRFCIITDLSRHVKMAIVDWRVTPGIALDDPMLMVGMPPALTAATGMGALPHGECNAILLPHVCKYNLIAKVERFAKLAVIMGENIAGLSLRKAAELAISAIQELSVDVGIPTGLVALGKRYGKDVQAKDIPTMTGNAQKDACGFTNPRCPSDADVIAIYTAAL